MDKVFIKYTGDKVVSFKGKRLGIRPIPMNVYTDEEFKKAVYRGALLKKSSASVKEIETLKSIPGIDIQGAKAVPKAPVKRVKAEAPKEVVKEEPKPEPEAVVSDEEKKLTQEEVKKMNRSELTDYLDKKKLRYRKSAKVSELEDIVLSNQ